MNLGQKTLTFFKLFQTQAKSDWQAFWSVFNCRLYFILWLITLAINFFLCYLLVKNLPQENINLHYNIIFGTDLIGAPSQLYFMPLVGLLITLVNQALAITWLKKFRLLTFINLNTALVINIFISLGLYSIFLINFVNIKF